MSHLQKRIKRLGAALKIYAKPIDDANLCWIFGAGRSGSTWLLELLSHLEDTRVWHEPYFEVFYHLYKDPGDLNRDGAFFSNAYRAVWTEGARHLFLAVAKARYGDLGLDTKLVIKDVNAPSLCPFFSEVFPRSRYLLLLRDPFDILDSYIDMQRPGSWNPTFNAAKFGQELSLERIRSTAEHIRKDFSMSVSGYDLVASDLRIQVRYEEMLAQPVENLARCAEFLGVPTPSQEELQRIVEARSFDKHEATGRQQFRRFGKAGIWQTSGNFTPEVTAVAQEVLGDLRARLGYAKTK
ncbi:MAG TPA: sulfotransferase [Chthonomonadaceae bacterium]|nr:sulfotransferase [Chthonomonadaceae bacterium]